MNKQAQSSEKIIIINKITNIRNGSHVRNFNELRIEYANDCNFEIWKCAE